jgi:hypothetical protein
MIVKTREFDETFTRDLSSLVRNYKIKGSYVVKQYGEPISDIDIDIPVRFDPAFPNFLQQIVKKAENGNFHFLYLNCGIRKEFGVPWTIDGKGSCDFSLETTQEWFNNFKNAKLVPVEVLKNIKNKFSQKLKLSDLIDIENILAKHNKIAWSVADVQTGYKVINGIRYDFAEVIKIKYPLLKFIYQYQNSFCAIDLALTDVNYNTAHGQIIYNYYTENWYTIMKIFRWKIKPEYRQEYLKIMTQITFAMAVKNEVELYDKAKRFYPEIAEKIYPSLVNDLKKINLEYSENTIEVIENKTNKILGKYIEYFNSKIQDKEKDDFLLFYKRGMEAQIPVSFQEIRERKNRGLKCPFFSTNIEDFNWLLDLSQRIDMNFEKILKCFLDTSEKFNISVRDVIEKMSQNKCRIIQGEIRDENNNVIMTGEKQDLQAFVLKNNL